MELQVLILLFCLPVIALTWAVPADYRYYPGIAGTFVFLAFYAPESLILLTATTLGSYALLRKVHPLYAATLAVCVLVFSIFLFFKMGWSGKLWMDRLLPLGISYYSFRQIHYALEAYKGKLPAHGFKDYVAYLFFLPTFLVGPIHRFPEFYKDQKRRRWDSALFSEGLERMLYGFAKIIVLGNYLLSDRAVSWVEGLMRKDWIWLATYLDAIRFTANAYLQFAGYSDIAIGLSLLLGFRVMENFNWPFLAPNISDFWQRWHISLSSWCRDYVYYPFYSLTRNPYVGVLFSMVILGLWHEISWNYFLWALAHVLAINAWHAYQHSKVRQQVHRWLSAPKGWGMFITFHFVIFSFILLYHHDLHEVWRTYKLLLGLHV